MSDTIIKNSLPQNLNGSILLPVWVSETARLMANIVYPDLTLHSVMSDLGLRYCSGMSVQLLRLDTLCVVTSMVYRHSFSVYVFIRC